MLIISRKAGETFEIGNHVKVMVLGVRGLQVRIGIDAPKDVPVHRSEIANRIRAENDGTLPGKEVS